MAQLCVGVEAKNIMGFLLKLQRRNQTYVFLLIPVVIDFRNQFFLPFLDFPFLDLLLDLPLFDLLSLEFLSLLELSFLLRSSLEDLPLLDLSFLSLS